TKVWFRLYAPLNPAPESVRNYALYYGAGIADAVNPPNNPNNVFIFDDDFESGNRAFPLNWILGKVGGYGTNWAIGVPGAGGQIAILNAYSGTRIVATGLTGAYAGRDPAAEALWLRSPAIPLTGKLNPTLSFYDVFDIEDPTAPYDYGVLRVYKTPVPLAGVPPNPSTALIKIEEQYLNEHYTWQQREYALNAAAGEQVYLEFVLRVDPAANGYGWGLDDIRIRQVADHEPDNPVLGIEEQVPLSPTIKAFFDVSVSPAAVSGPDQINGLAEGTEINTGQPISDNSAAVPLVWEIAAQDITTYGNPFYMMPKDTFNAGEAVYAKGSGYPSGVYYRVSWFNPSGSAETVVSVTPDTSGALFNNRTMTAIDGSGRWRLVVENAAGTVKYAETTFFLNTKPQLLSELILPDFAIQGQQITLSEHVKNAGQTPAVGVTPTSPTVSGEGSVNSISGPTPMALTINGGATGEFTWTMVASLPGNVHFRGNVAGTVEGSSIQTQSASAGSNICRILSEQLDIDQVSAVPSVITRGQTGVPVSVNLSNAGTADLNIASVSFTARQMALNRSSEYSAIVTAPVIPIKLQGKQYPPWWNTNYKYRQRLRITSDELMYPINSSSHITIKTDDLIAAGKLQADRDDWRVMQWDEGAGSWTQLDRHYLSGNNSVFKIRSNILPYDRDENYYVYYGNSAATNADLNANRKNCYIFWEDWEDSVYANGYTRLTNGIQANFPGWTLNDKGKDGIYISRNNNDTFNVQLNRTSTPALAAQSLCFRMIDFGDIFNLNQYVQAYRQIDTTGYHHLKLTYHRYFDNSCEWDYVSNSTNYDWSRVRVYDGAIWNQIIFYPSKGPNDDQWHEETYDLSAIQTGPLWGIQFEGNFWYTGEDNKNRIWFDDIRLFMDAPNAIGLGEETIPVTTMTATLSVDVSAAATPGLTTIDAAATASSLVATGSVSAQNATWNDTWTVSNTTMQTFSDAGATVLCSRFPRGQPVTVKGSGYTPFKTHSLCWHDAFPPDAAPIASFAAAANAAGEVSLTYTPTAAFRYGLCTIHVRDGATVLATGSFRLLEKPYLMPLFDLSPASGSLGVPMAAVLAVKASVIGDTFETGTVGAAPPAPWIAAGPGSEIIDNAAVYAANPPTRFVHLSHNAAADVTLKRIVNLRDMTALSLHARYSTVFAGAPAFSVESSPDGAIWTTLFTDTASLGAGTW
ncbi:MAG TPA: hypothetical protein PKM25_07500, partial [Candidatus Ozemobacteraceae bacterium]|nr:hypothetical protein [Candidatus Ozemobacteraceae bacterium]